MSDTEHRGGLGAEKKGGMYDTTRQIICERVAHETTLSKQARERLRLDLTSNATADYSRINLTEVFSAFNFDALQTSTHWRLGKIMDGIEICTQELKLNVEGPNGDFGPNNFPRAIYGPIKEGKADEKVLTIQMPNSNTEDGKVEGKIPEFKVSLADFAYLLDVINLNKTLGAKRIDLMELVYNFFDKDKKLLVKCQQGNGEVKEIDLKDTEINPRDDFKDIDIDSYFATIKACQSGLNQMGNWRWTSSGHREIGGHSFSITHRGEVMWVPVCGRLAARLTLTDLEKDPKKEAGMNGQPQEVGEMDEEKSGAIIRFRIADLAQRRKGTDANTVKMKSARLKKAMVGMILDEDSFSQKFEGGAEDDKDYAEEKAREGNKKSKTVIYLCGRKLENKIIGGIKFHHGALYRKLFGIEMPDREAADIAMTDVFIPCIINNVNDWLSAVADVYGVGGPRGVQSIINQNDVFQDFELRIMCHDFKDGEIRWQTFNGMVALKEYIKRRVEAGHIDQPEAKKLLVRSDIEHKKTGKDSGTAIERVGYKEDLSAEEGKKIGEILRIVFGDDARKLIKQYKQSGDQSIAFKDREGVTSVRPFSAVVCERLLKHKEDGEVIEAIESYLGLSIEAEDLDIETLVSNIASTLADLKAGPRKKIT